MTLPRPDYLWFRPDDYDAPEGEAWERRIQDIIANVMRTW